MFGIVGVGVMPGVGVSTGVAAECTGAPVPQAMSTSSRKLNGNRRTFFIAHTNLSSMQCDHRNLTRNLGLMLHEKGIQLYYPGPQPLALRTFHDDGGGVEDFGLELDGDFWMCHQIAIPVGMALCTRVGGDHE